MCSYGGKTTYQLPRFGLCNPIRTRVCIIPNMPATTDRTGRVGIRPSEHYLFCRSGLHFILNDERAYSLTDVHSQNVTDFRIPYFWFVDCTTSHPDSLIWFQIMVLSWSRMIKGRVAETHLQTYQFRRPESFRPLVCADVSAPPETETIHIPPVRRWPISFASPGWTITLCWCTCGIEIFRQSHFALVIAIFTHYTRSKPWRSKVEQMLHRRDFIHPA